MNIWRVSDYPDLSGQGGIVTGARWNEVKTPVVYCADHPATAILEKLAHLDVEDLPTGYTLLKIDIPDDAVSHRVEAGELPEDWKTAFRVTQSIGTKLLTEAAHLIVWVPSVLAPYTWNALLNPRHRQARRCHVAEVIREFFDARLIR